MNSPAVQQPNKQAPEAQTKQEQKPPLKAGPAAVPETYKAYPSKYADACYQAQNHDTADLCAQWRAAIAAEHTANEAAAANWIMGGGALLSFIGIVLVLIALGQTRKANQISTIQTKIASDTAKQQLRAHIGIAETELTIPTEEMGAGEVVFLLKNFGGSPAIRMEASIAITTTIRGKDKTDIPTEWDIEGKKLAIDVAPSATAFRRMVLPNSATEYLSELKQGTRALWVSLAIEYLDIFGTKYTQKTMFGCSGRFFRQQMLTIWIQEPEQCEERPQNHESPIPFWRRWFALHVTRG